MLSAFRRLAPKGKTLAPLALPALTPALDLLGSVRWKQTKRQSYWKPPRAKPCGQPQPQRLGRSGGLYIICLLTQTETS